MFTFFWCGFEYTNERVRAKHVACLIKADRKRLQRWLLLFKVVSHVMAIHLQAATITTEKNITYVD